MGINVRGIVPLLFVFDMPTSIKFYCDVLGFKIKNTSGPGPDFGWALLSLSGVELMLNTLYDKDERPPMPEASRVAAHPDTCLYFTCPDVDAAYAHLRAHGMKVDRPSVAYYGMKQVYVADPDGYSLCFQWPANQQPHDNSVAREGLEPKAIE